MEFEVFLGVVVMAVLAGGELVRRTVLGRRLEDSLETVKARGLVEVPASRSMSRDQDRAEASWVLS
jgi:hypothetical protein